MHITPITKKIDITQLKRIKGENMSLSDSFRKWNEAFSGAKKSRQEQEQYLAMRPYLAELALADRNKKVAEGNNASQYFRGRAQEQEKNAGLKALELQFAPQTMQADLESKRASTGYTGANTRNLNFKNQNPLFGQTGTAGQLGALIYLQNHPELVSSFEGNNVPRQELPGNVRASNEKYSPWKREDLEINQEGIQRLNNLMAGQSKMEQPRQGIGKPPQQKNDMLSLLRDSITNDIKRKNAYGELANKKVENYGYGQLTADQKRGWTAKAAGMGVSETDSRNFFNKGGSIEDLAVEKGFDPDDMPEAIYNATTTDLTRAHFRAQAAAELRVLEPLTTEALAPYAQRVDGYSPVQIVEALSGENPDAQARFFAAKALIPEINALRTKMMGGQVGIGALEELKASAMANFKAWEGILTPEVYAASQRYMQEWLDEATKTANTLAYNPEKGQNKEVGAKKNTGSGNNEEKVLVYDPAKGTFK